jgi:phenylpropionate dioxygenase-like ring-hydroxylating dioxygenase large terminal subunit
MATQLKQELPLYDRGVKFSPQGVGGYDANWYPVCLSTELAKGDVKGFDFLDGRVVVYRSSEGSAQVLSPFCRHLGVDLSIGKVIGDQLRCPYHHWKYDQTGKCVATALGDPPPARAKLFRFPTVESLGLIWAYNGEEPAYETPHFSIDESELEISTIRSVEVPMDPFMLYSNSLDLQHLISVHGIRFTETPKDFPIDGGRTISYIQKMVVPGLGESVQNVKLWGTNCIQLESDIANRPTFMMSAGLAVAGPLTRTFNVTATLKQVDKAGDEQMRDMHIKMVEQFGLQLNREDDPVMRTISPRLDNLTKSDHGLSVYFNFVRKYPRFEGASDMIRNDYRATATPAGPPPPVLTNIIFDPSETGHHDD